MTKCPVCGKLMKKGGVSRYWCKFCRQWWLVQPLSTYPPPDAVPPKSRCNE